MIQITPDQVAALADRFIPERQALIALHARNTGHGACFVDRWPEPRVLLVTIGMLCSLLGEPDALAEDDLKDHIAGLMYASRQFVPLLETVFPDVREVERLYLTLPEEARFDTPADVTLRRLEANDADHLAGLAADLRWIANTWRGAAGLAASGYAWGAFSQGKLVSLAGTFLLGDAFEDIGVVTEADHRGRGLAVACAGALCQDVQSRGRRASWTTSIDNPASLRVAEKLGFRLQGHESLYNLGQPAPSR